MTTVEYYFDFSCPYAYIGSTRIEQICKQHGAQLVWKPMLLGGVFAGNNTPQTISYPPSKAQHNLSDMHRWAELYGVPLSQPAGHPIRTVRALRALLASPGEHWASIIHSLYRAYWREGIDISSEGNLRSVLSRTSLTPEQVETALSANEDPIIKTELRNRTDEALERKIFGAPTIFANGVMLFGQDRLSLLEEVLDGWKPGETSPTVSRAPVSPVDVQKVEFWYDYSSPYAYLASTQIERFAKDCQLEVSWRPMLLGAVFKEIGTPVVPIASMGANRQAYMGKDLNHWASYWDVPFKFSSRFPMNTVKALRMTLQAGEKTIPLSNAFFAEMWEQDGDLGNDDRLIELANQVGLDGEKLLAGTADPQIKQRLFANTTEAVEKGVFGAPAIIVQTNERPYLFWGQDRIDLAKRVVGGFRPTK